MSVFRYMYEKARGVPAITDWFKQYITCETVEGEERVTKHPVNDWTPIQPFLVSPNPFERLNSLLALKLLAELPTNAMMGLELLRDIIFAEALPETAQLSLFPPESMALWDLGRALGVHPRAEAREHALITVNKILDEYYKAESPEEVAVFQKAVVVLKEAVLATIDPALRVHAIWFIGSKLSQVKAVMEPEFIETWFRHLIFLATNSTVPLPVRFAAFNKLRLNLERKENQLHYRSIDTWGPEEVLRLLHLALDILWEDPTSTKWAEEGGPIGLALKIALRYHKFLPPADYKRLLEILRAALVYPLPASREKLYGDHPLVGWYVMKRRIAEFLQPEWRRKKAETLLLDLVRSPTDLELLRGAQEWAARCKLGAFWAEYLMRAETKLRGQR